VASIPASRLEGTHGVAAFDIDGDGWKDLVVGLCSGTRVFMSQAPGAPAGSAPDGDAVPGTQLLVDKADGEEITLSWGGSCAASDTDYEVYEGTLGDKANIEPRACTTGNEETITLLPGAGNRYYLVVPTNGVTEGSYGTTSSGGKRGPSANACLQQHIAPCD
jgi:hypothetical protein